VAPGGVLAREVVVPPTGSARVSEHELLLVGSGRLAVKGPELAAHPWPAAGHGELGLGVETWRDARLDYWGIGTGDDFGVGAELRFDGRLGLTDRLAWKVGTLALAYRLGDPGGAEAAFHAGLVSWKLPLTEARDRNIGGYARGAGEARLGAGMALRSPFSLGAIVYSLEGDQLVVGGLRGASFQLAVGLTLRLSPAVTLHVAVAVGGEEVHDLKEPISLTDPAAAERLIEPGLTGAIGSVQSFGLESLPLLRICPSGTWALDLFASGATYDRISVRLGVSRRF
jgi:hypothetical protein